LHTLRDLFLLRVTSRSDYGLGQFFDHYHRP
jgi:hypothetical protein